MRLNVPTESCHKRKEREAGAYGSRPVIPGAHSCHQQSLELARKGCSHDHMKGALGFCHLRGPTAGLYCYCCKMVISSLLFLLQVSGEGMLLS